MSRVDIFFTVEGQRLSQDNNNSELHAGDKQHFYAVFDLEEAFSELEGSLRAVFTKQGKAVIIDLIKNASGKFECIIPWEAMYTAGFFTVGIFGGEMMLTNALSVKVSQGCIPSGDAPLEPTPGWFTIVEDEIEDIKRRLKGLEEAGPDAVTSVAGKKGDVVLSKEDVGLNDVDNTSDEDKPLSKAARDKIASVEKDIQGVQAEIPKSLSQLSNDSGFITSKETDNKISSHNTDIESHNDIRIKIKEITDRLNAFLDTDDDTLDQLSEVVACINDNKELIDSITTSKVNVADIIDNLTTGASDKPLSAKQGAALKALIDAIVIPTRVSELSNDSGFISGAQTDNKVATHNAAEDAHGDIRIKIKEVSDRLNAFLDTDDTTLDQLSEIVGYIMSNKELIDSITTSKVSISDIIDNLTISAHDKPLSAKQGVVLKSLIDELNAAVIMINNSRPYIGDNNHWYEWDAETEKYIDTGVQAEGKDGHTPEKGVDYWTDADKADIKAYVAPLIVNVTVYADGAVELDKTDSEISSAYEDGKAVLAYVEHHGGNKGDYIISQGEEVQILTLVRYEWITGYKFFFANIDRTNSDAYQATYLWNEGAKMDLEGNLDNGWRIKAEALSSKSYVDNQIGDIETALDGLQYYGDANTIPSDASLFSFTTDSETMTASVRLKEEFRLDSTLTKIVIPYEIEGLPVTSIMAVAFEFCTGLTSINIPNSVTNIGNYAFDHCTGLTSINIPNSVTNIGTNAFYGCDNLTIICAAGSYADTYAKENGIAVEYTNEVTKSYVDNQIGDINNALERIVAIQNQTLGVSE